MLKRTMVALAGLLIVLGLAVAPASGEQVEAQTMTVFSLPEFGGDPEPVDVPGTSCTALPAGITAQSARNPNVSPEVLFYSETDCNEADFVGAVPSEGENAEFTSPATHYRTTS